MTNSELDKNLQTCSFSLPLLTCNIALSGQLVFSILERKRERETEGQISLVFRFHSAGLKVPNCLQIWSVLGTKPLQVVKARLWTSSKERENFPAHLHKGVLYEVINLGFKFSVYSRAIGGKG